MGAPSIRPDLTFQLSWRGSLEAALLFRRLQPSFVTMTLLIILGPGSAIDIVYTEGSAWVVWMSLTSDFAVLDMQHSDKLRRDVVFVAVVKFLRLTGTS